MLVAPASARPGFRRLPVRRRRRGDHQQRAHADRKPARGRRQWRRDLPGQPGKAAVIDAAAGSPDLHPHGGSRRPRGRAQTGAAGRAGGRDDRRQAAVRRQERRRRRQGRFRRRVRRPRRQAAGARWPALRAVEDRIPLSMVSPEFVLGIRAGQIDHARRRWRSHHRRRQAVADHAVAAARPLSPRRQIDRGRRAADVGAVRCRLVFRRQRRYAGPAGNLDRQAGISIRRHHGGVGQRALGRQADHQRAGRPAADHPNHRRQGRHRAGQDSRRQGLGHRRLCGGDAAPSARCRRTADAGPRHRPEMVRHRQEDPHAPGQPVAAGIGASRHHAEAAGQTRRPQAPAKTPRSSLPPSMSAFSI